MQRGNAEQRLKMAMLNVVRQNPELTPAFDRDAIRAKALRGEFQTQDGLPTFAYINHGRWVADCPVCNSAAFVERGHDMLCGECGAVNPVDWPTAKDETEAERLLRQRPVGNQNWERHKGEPVDALLAENIDHGLGI